MESKEYTICIDGWYFEIEIFFDYKIYGGYPATRFEPEDPSEIEFTINEDRTISSIIKTIADVIDETKDKGGISYSMDKVLDDIQDKLDEDDILQSQLFEDSRTDYEAERAEYLSDQMKDRQLEDN